VSTDDNAWNLVTIVIGREVEEVAVSLLFELGATGTVTIDETLDSSEIGAYFQPEVSADYVVAELKYRLGDLNLLGYLKEARSKRIQNEDWLRKWKEGFEATEVGDSLLVAPSWKIGELFANTGESHAGFGGMVFGARSANSLGGRLLIQIDPGMAFGTGTHETTRLCLEAIERNWKGGRFLDVGTGTGILAIAAAVLAPGSEVVGIDTDPVAVEVARQNLTANNVTTVEASEAPVSQYSSGDFDVVVANLTAGIVLDILDALIAALSRSGCLIISGLLVEQAADVALALKTAGLARIERHDAGEWACLVARYDPGQ